jgi:LacI family transcriptional regulator
LTNSDEDLAIERDAVRVLLDKRVDGIIVAPADIRKTDHLADALASGTPVVLLDRAAPRLPADAVLADNVSAGRSAVEHLLGLGHRRIMVIAELAHPREAEWVRRAAADGRIRRKAMNPTTQRVVGYLEAHGAAGIPVPPELIRATGRYSAEVAFEAARDALRTVPEVTALFSTDSSMTLGAYEAVRDAGVAIPNEVSFVGFDDIVWTRLVEPPLTVGLPTRLRDGPDCG